MLSRRHFLRNSAALAATPMLPRKSAAWDHHTPLIAAPAMAQIAPEGYGETGLWTFGGSLPGTELRFRQGDQLAIRVQNDLPQATSVHWHGLHVPNAMDGVPDLTQTPIEPGQTFDYEFDLPDAGTYWYHSHQQSTEQVERGLYGAIVIEEADGPDVDADLTLVLDDILLTPEAKLAEDFDNPGGASHGGRLGNLILTNGTIDWRQTAHSGDRLRLRLINAATARVFQLGLSGMQGWVVAYDGMPLVAPQPVTEPFPLAPAQRIDLIVDVQADPGMQAHLVQYERDGGYSQASFDISGRSASAARPAPMPLPMNPGWTAPDLANAQNIDMRLEGGMMGQMRAATFQGETMDTRALMQQGQFWALNGTAGMTDTPLARLSSGESARMSLSNDTAFPHAMHLHGMHFAEIAPDGSFGALRDTILVMPRAAQDIAFVADNPGKWLFHCHMLSHQATGMKTWIEVT